MSSCEIPLVLEIEKRPCLYNFNMVEYNRKDHTEAAWAEIAEIINFTVNECKDKWKNIRNSLLRSLKPNGGKLKKPYYLSHYLQFILPYLKPLGVEYNPEDAQAHTGELLTNNRINDVVSEMFTIKLEPEIDSEDPLDSPPKEREKRGRVRSNDNSVLKRKRNVAQIRQQQLAMNQKSYRHAALASRDKTQNSAVKLFLLSLLPELDSMDENQVRLFKIKVMMLIDEIKSDASNARADFPDKGENLRLQKKLINLLLKSLKSKRDSSPDD